MATAVSYIIVSPGITAGSPFVPGDALIVEQTSPALAVSTPVIFVDRTASPQQVQIGPITSNAGATVIGSGATVTGGSGSTDVVVIGTDATVDHQRSVAIGPSASASGEPSVAIGFNASVIGPSGGGVAVGVGTSVGDAATAIGQGASAATGVAVGSNTTAEESGVALGNSAGAFNTLNKGLGGIAIGHNAQTGESTDVVISSGAKTGSGTGAGGNIVLTGSVGSFPTLTGANNILIGAGSGENGNANDDSPNSGAQSNATIIGGGSVAAHSAVTIIARGVTSTAANQGVLGGLYNAIANLYIGNGIATPIPQDVVINATGAVGSNIGAASLTLAGGIGTGTGIGGAIVFQTAAVGGTGTTPGVLTTALTIDATQIVTFANAPQVTATLTPASGALTLLNGPTGASGNPTLYAVILVGGTSYAVPLWAV